MMILLTAGEAETVRGPTARGARLEPRALVDGGFALPDAVLADPAHARHHALLSGLPLVEDAACAWAPDESED